MTKTERRFVAHRVAGGLLPADFLGKVAALDAGQDIAAYGLTKSLNMRDEIGRHRRIASDLWADFRAIRASAQVERTADRWLLPFLSRGLLSPSRGRPSVNDHSFHHPPRQRMLDAAGAVLPGVRPRQAGRRLRRGEGRRRTPHSLVREFFNADDGALWGIVSNGLVFRILRDNPSLTLPAYIEMDLERTFENRLYAASPPSGSPPMPPASCLARTTCRRAASSSAGGRARRRSASATREKLRFGVTEALLALGRSFVTQPGNGRLRADWTCPGFVER